MKISNTIPIQDKIDAFNKNIQYLDKVKSLCPDTEVFLSGRDLLCFSKTLTDVDNIIIKIEYPKEVQIHYAYIHKLYQDTELSVEIFVEPIVPLFTRQGYNHLYFMNYQDVITRYFKKNEKIIIDKCDKYILNWIKENQQNIDKNLDYLPIRIKNLMVFS